MAKSFCSYSTMCFAIKHYVALVAPVVFYTNLLNHSTKCVVLPLFSSNCCGALVTAMRHDTLTLYIHSMMLKVGRDQGILWEENNPKVRERKGS